MKKTPIELLFLAMTLISFIFSGCIKGGMFPLRGANQKLEYFSKQEIKRADIFAKSFPEIVFYPIARDSNLVFLAFVDEQLPVDTASYKKNQVYAYAYKAYQRIFQESPRSTLSRNIVFDIQFWDTAQQRIAGRFHIRYPLSTFP